MNILKKAKNILSLIQKANSKSDQNRYGKLADWLDMKYHKALSEWAEEQRKKYES